MRYGCRCGEWADIESNQDDVVPTWLGAGQGGRETGKDEVELELELELRESQDQNGYDLTRPTLGE